MTNRIDSGTEFSSDSFARAVKQLFALALASFPDATFERVAAWCDVSASLVKAWVDPKRPHCPPAWVPLRLRQKHPALSAYLDTGLEALAREGARGPVAHTLEAQGNALVGTLVRLVGQHSEAVVDNHYDTDEARRLAASGAYAISVLQRFVAQCERRAGLDAQTALRAVQ